MLILFLSLLLLAVHGFDLSSYPLTAQSVVLGCDDKCVLENEYWLRYNFFGGTNRSIVWPPSCEDGNFFGFTESNNFFGVDTWYEVFSFSTPTTDECYNTGKDYIATRLNICNGACSDIYVDLALAELAQIFQDWCGSAQPLVTGGTVAQQYARNRTLELQQVLIQFNNGTGSSSPCTWCDSFYTGDYSSADCDVVPMVDCNSVIEDVEVCATLWGWTNNEAHTVFIQEGVRNYSNYFSPDPESRGQGIFFQTGSHQGVFSTMRNCTAEPMLTWNLAESSATALGIQTCPIVDRYAHDCNANNVSDYCEILYEDNGENCIAATADARCFLNGLSAEDGCLEINTTTVFDCNYNLLIDECEIASMSNISCTDPMCDGITFELRPTECITCYSNDTNVNTIPDSCEDCNANNITDVEEISMMLTADCDGNMVPDECQIAENPSLDCNNNMILDSCEITSGAEEDCNNNTIPDSCDLMNSLFFPDCDSDGIIDSCGIANGTNVDCDGNLRPDSCDIAEGLQDDCDLNTVPDSCQIDADPSIDCNNDQIIDNCTIDSFPSLDCNNNTILDECEPLTDCNANEVPDDCDILYGGFDDCDEDWNLDVCQITANPSFDCNSNLQLDVCEIQANGTLDCDNNGVLDSCQILGNPSLDCDLNGVLDMCQISANFSLDCNNDDILDSCQILGNPSLDCNTDGVIDSCQISSNPALDCDLNSILDTCDIAGNASLDCNIDAMIDFCQILADPSIDCDNNTIIDTCQIADMTSQDCNLNNVPDDCDIAAMTSMDLNNDTIPDECQTFGACCQGVVCTENVSIPVCGSLVGTFFEGIMCSADPCAPASTSTPPTTSSSTEPTGSCCLSGQCFDGLTDSECGGSFSLNSCVMRTDCSAQSSSQSTSSRSVAIFVIALVLSCLCIVASALIAFVLLTKKKRTKKRA